jgi:hypothetical protein
LDQAFALDHHRCYCEIQLFVDELVVVVAGSWGVLGVEWVVVVVVVVVVVAAVEAAVEAAVVAVGVAA